MEKGVLLSELNGETIKKSIELQDASSAVSLCEKNIMKPENRLLATKNWIRDAENWKSQYTAQFSTEFHLSVLEPFYQAGQSFHILMPELQILSERINILRSYTALIESPSQILQSDILQIIAAIKSKDIPVSVYQFLLNMNMQADNLIKRSTILIEQLSISYRNIPLLPEILFDVNFGQVKYHN